MNQIKTSSGRCWFYFKNRDLLFSVCWWWSFPNHKTLLGIQAEQQWEKKLIKCLHITNNNIQIQWETMSFTPPLAFSLHQWLIWSHVHVQVDQQSAKAFDCCPPALSGVWHTCTYMNLNLVRCKLWELNLNIEASSKVKYTSLSCCTEIQHFPKVKPQPTDRPLLSGCRACH